MNFRRNSIHFEDHPKLQKNKKEWHGSFMIFVLFAEAVSSVTTTKSFRLRNVCPLSMVCLSLLGSLSSLCITCQPALMADTWKVSIGWMTDAALWASSPLILVKCFGPLPSSREKDSFDSTTSSYPNRRLHFDAWHLEKSGSTSLKRNNLDTSRVHPRPNFCCAIPCCYYWSK